MRKVYTAESLVDGQLLVDSLNSAGIPAQLFHQNSQGGLGELPVTYPEVWITRNLDMERALLVISRLSSTEPDSVARRCPHCGESSPGSFEICWQCHRTLPESE